MKFNAVKKIVLKEFETEIGPGTKANLFDRGNKVESTPLKDDPKLKENYELLQRTMKYLRSKKLLNAISSYNINDYDIVPIANGAVRVNLESLDENGKKRDPLIITGAQLSAFASKGEIK